MKLLHTMLRVTNLQESIEFYTNVLGMKVLDRTENDEYRYTLVFVGYSGQVDAATIELTYNWDVSQYTQGNAFGHVALGVDDIYAACDRIKTLGGKVTREPGLVKGGDTHIAFLNDPDGYQIELVQIDK